MGGRQRLVDEQPERVDVGAGVGGAAVDLFGREVAGGAHHGARAGEVVAARGLGDAEVGDLHRARRRDEHVGGLHVAVDEPARCAASSASATCLPMRMTSATGRPPLLVDEVAQRGAVDQLHDDVGDAVVVAGVVGGDDVGM